MSVVYFIEAEGTGLIKIGYTDNLKKRLSDLRATSPVPLKLLARLPNAGSWREAVLHDRFSKYRQRNEWFKLSGPILKYIENANELYPIKVPLRK